MLLKGIGKMTELLNIGLLLSFFAVMLLVLINLTIHSDQGKNPEIKKNIFLKFWERLRNKKGIGIEKNEDKT